jgi:hypothetical protein
VRTTHRSRASSRGPEILFYVLYLGSFPCTRISPNQKTCLNQLRWWLAYLLSEAFDGRIVHTSLKSQRSNRHRKVVLSLFFQPPWHHMSWSIVPCCSAEGLIPPLSEIFNDYNDGGGARAEDKIYEYKLHIHACLASNSRGQIICGSWRFQGDQSGGYHDRFGEG